MEESVFIKWAALTLIIFILSISSCSMYKVSKVTEMVNKGADPLAVNCLIYVSNNNDAVCALLTTKR